jgi:hypothetical protein
MQDIQPQSGSEDQSSSERASFEQAPERRLNRKVLLHVGLALLTLVGFVDGLVFSFTANRVLLTTAFLGGIVAAAFDIWWAQWRQHRRKERQAYASKATSGPFSVWYVLLLAAILAGAFVLPKLPRPAYEIVFSLSVGTIVVTSLRNAYRAWSNPFNL